MTDKPYTHADVELVEQAIYGVTPTIVDGYVDGRDLLTAEACAVLEALAAAGRLAPVDDANTEPEQPAPGSPADRAQDAKPCRGCFACSTAPDCQTEQEG